MSETPTIFALSTAPGRAGIAVVRVSGPRAGDVLDRLTRRPRPAPRYAALRGLQHPETGEGLDQALVLWFPAPASETGEDVAELHLHGGRAVVASVLAALGTFDGCRLAGQGEFARRAFENGKLDLTQAEGLADLFDAETEAQRRQALRQAGGALERLYESWRTELIAVLALVEAAIDFSDEGGVAADALLQAETKAGKLAREIHLHLEDNNRGEIIRDGFRVVLSGPPNAGKSSLLNALARRDIAIVSDEAGTTRDVIETRLDIAGLAVVVSDTAGIRESRGKIEREGIRRTFQRADEAELVIWVEDQMAPPVAPPPELRRHPDRFLSVANKGDLAAPLPSETRLVVSAKTGGGLSALTAEIARRAEARIGAGDALAPTQARHRGELTACRDALQEFLSSAGSHGAAPELAAENVRHAARAIGRLMGRVDPEEVLGQIFGRFCIGK